MNEKEKKVYSMLLSLRLSKMIEANIKEKQKWEQVVAKHNNNQKLTKAEIDCFYRAGAKYTKSAINRVRIELSQVLMEINKEQQL